MGPGWSDYFGQFPGWSWASAHAYRNRATLEMVKAVYELRRSLTLW